MAMARVISQSLSRTSLHHPVLTPRALISHRHRSNRSGKSQAQLIEIDLDPSSSSQNESDSPEVLHVGVKRLEEAIHSVMVRRAAPDWLPFLPGYSYWVPPQGKNIMGNRAGLIEVIGNLTSTEAEGSRGRMAPFEIMSQDEMMSFNSSRGWPSSSYFIEGRTSLQTVPVMEVEVKFHQKAEKADNNSSSEEEEG